MTCYGTLQLAELQQVIVIIEEVIGRYGRYGTILDARRLDSLTPRPAGMLRSGAAPPRVLATPSLDRNRRTGGLDAGIAGDLSVFRSTFPTQFFGNEEEARTWLMSRRPPAPSQKTAR